MISWRPLRFTADIARIDHAIAVKRLFFEVYALTVVLDVAQELGAHLHNAFRSACACSEQYRTVRREFTPGNVVYPVDEVGRHADGLRDFG